MYFFYLYVRVSIPHIVYIMAALDQTISLSNGTVTDYCAVAWCMNKKPLTFKVKNDYKNTNI